MELESLEWTGDEEASLLALESYENSIQTSTSSSLLKWNCVLCTFANPVPRLACEMCSTERPHTSSSSSSRVKENDEYKGPKWICTQCQEPNPMGKKECIKCLKKETILQGTVTPLQNAKPIANMKIAATIAKPISKIATNGKLVQQTLDSQCMKKIVSTEDGKAKTSTSQKTTHLKTGKKSSQQTTLHSIKKKVPKYGNSDRYLIPDAPAVQIDIEKAHDWIYPTNYPVREYQFSIVKQALFQNTLVSLPTGSKPPR